VQCHLEDTFDLLNDMAHFRCWQAEIEKKEKKITEKREDYQKKREDDQNRRNDAMQSREGTL